MAHSMYENAEISERHRHRYEVNIAYRDRLEQAGMKFSGLSPDGSLPEIVERPDHPWFVGVQFHPELKSKPFDPHPLFTGFVAASMEKSKRLSSYMSGSGGLKVSMTSFNIADVPCGDDNPLLLISGPCQVEGLDHALMCAEKLAGIAAAGMGFVYKSSYDKANRTSFCGARCWHG